MRKVTQISKANCIAIHGFMSVDEKCQIEDVIDILTRIIDRRVGHMLDKQQFKEQTQEVVDFIDTIIYEIIVDVLNYFSVPADDEEETDN
jgi:hypothetical protein